ncbi:hypothetical protein C8R47DRAFT_1209169 [Mycena vitilis]|nr:hypothetical protein C8R47DRAFT_1209169 [Mycena vitilis]
MLRSRVMKAWSIHVAWRKQALEPSRVRVIPVEDGTSRFVCIPWTHVVVVLVENDLFLHNWSSGARVHVPISQETPVFTLSMKVFWMGSRCILIVLSLGPPELGDDLQLFSLDPVLMSISFLTSVFIPHSVSRIDMRGNHLAVVGHTGNSYTAVIRSFRLSFLPNFTVCVRADARFEGRVNFGDTSFALVDDNRFLLVGPRRIHLYRLSTAASSSSLPHGGSITRIGSFPYPIPDNFRCPSLGPIVAGIDGTISFSVCTGEYLQCVSITPVQTASGILGSDFVTKRLADELPVDFGVSTGFRVSVFRLPPSSSPMFTTFTLPSVLEEDSLHPFFYEGDHRGSVKGSVVFVPSEDEFLEVGTLQVDEGQGQIMFIVRSYSEPFTKIIVLDLV